MKIASKAHRKRIAKEHKRQKLVQEKSTLTKLDGKIKGGGVAFLWVIMGFSLGMCVMFFILKDQFFKNKSIGGIKKHKTNPTKKNLKGKDFSFVLNMTPEEVKKYDMVELNLLCGSGLNVNEKGDLDQCMKVFDGLVGMVLAETQRNWGRWQSNPAEYQNSEAYYRMGMLITVIRQDFGAKYNPKLITDPSKMVDDNVFYKDASNVFLQGLLTGKKMGTCASMPVLYVAVARRLGYPVHLVSTKGHLFCRWEDNKERMNFEGTGEGVRTDPDEAYHKFPYKLTKWEIENSTYLKNLTRAQELAIFLDTRASCLVDSKRNSEALIANAQAIRLTQKSGLTGLMESTTFGRMIPNQIFQLMRQRNSQNRKIDQTFNKIEELNRINQRKMNTRLPHNPYPPNFGLPNFQHNPHLP